VTLRYRHPGADTIRDEVYARCAREGVTNPKARERLVEQETAKHRALLDENPNLCGEPLRDLLRAKAALPPGPELEARNRAALAVVRVPIYRTERQAIELANRADAHLKANQPELRRELPKGGGCAVTVTRQLMGEQLEREAVGAARSVDLRVSTDSTAGNAGRAVAADAPLNPKALQPARLRVR